jgi:hypothetical protein
MNRIRWSRVLLCGSVAGLVWIFTSSIATWFLGAEFNAATGGKVFEPGVALFSFLFALSLLGGIWAMWLYASIRAQYGQGPRTALIARISWWVVSSLADFTWASLGFVTLKAFLPLSLIALPELILATLVGAWLYKD